MKSNKALTVFAVLTLLTCSVHAEKKPVEAAWAPPDLSSVGFEHAWVPPKPFGAVFKPVDFGYTLLPDLVETVTPKPTADMLAFKREYKIELKRFGIFNDGTHPVETANGLNAALQHARSNAFNRIVFPSGTYVISELTPLELNHQNTVIDLNGATLKINPNGQPKYTLVRIIDGAKSLRLTNGTLLGDRDEHDYKTQSGTHEWGAGLSMMGGEEIEIDHLTLEGFTGDGVSSTSIGSRDRPELLARIHHSVYGKDLESGGFDAAGSKVDNPATIRTREPRDLTRCKGRFEVGYQAGYLGFPFIRDRRYRIIFLNEAGQVVEQRDALQYRQVSVPVGATQANFLFYQADIPEEPAHAGAAKNSWMVRITRFTPSTDVHFHHNRMIRNRRLGMAFCGGQRWVIEENQFVNSGGASPAFGVDFEDGWELMQDVVFRRNTFKGNQAGDLVVCAGSELLFEDNVFEKSVVVHGRPHHYTFRRNRFTGGSVKYSTRTGIASIHDNTYENCKQVTVHFDTKGVADGLDHLAKQPIPTPSLQLRNETFKRVEKVSGTYLDFKDSRFIETAFVAGGDTQLARFMNCQFEASTLTFEAKGPEVVWVVVPKAEGLLVDGPGLARKRGVSTTESTDADAGGQ